MWDRTILGLISDRFKRLYELPDIERDVFKTMIPTLNKAIEGGLADGKK